MLMKNAHEKWAHTVIHYHRLPLRSAPRCQAVTVANEVSLRPLDQYKLKSEAQPAQALPNEAAHRSQDEQETLHDDFGTLN